MSARSLSRYFPAAARLVLLCSSLTAPAWAAPTAATLQEAGPASAVLPDAASTAAGRSRHPYTIDDQLKLESVGDATSDPTGRWLVWEQAPPYEKIGDYSLGQNTLGSGYRLMALDTLTPGAMPLDLVAGQDGNSFWIDGFSPDGRYLVYYGASAGAYSMGVYDFKTGKSQRFDAAPNLHHLAGHRSTWLSPHEFTFAAYPPGLQPLDAYRRQTGKSLWRDWNAAWRGELSVGEMVSHAESGNERPLRGRLMKVDTRTGTMSTVASGFYNSLRASPDGRYLAALRQYTLLQRDPGVGSKDWTTSRSQLQVFEIAKGAKPIEVATDRDVFPNTLEWSQDSKRLAFFSWRLGAPVQSGTFVAFSTADKRVTAFPHRGLDLVSERERFMFEKPERAVWIGDRLAVAARSLPDRNAPPKFTYAAQSAADYNGQRPRSDWFLIDADGRHENLTGSLGQPSPLLFGADGRSLTVLSDRRLFQVSPGKPPARIASQVDGELEGTPEIGYATIHPPFERFRTVVARNGTSLSAVAIDLASGDAKAVPISSVANLMAFAGSTGKALLQNSDKGVLTLETRQGNEAPRKLVRLNGHMDQVQPTDYSVLNYSVDTPAGKKDVGACMILPPDYQPGRRYPVIVHIYPGINLLCRSPGSERYFGFGRPGADLHLLAARGYIVLEPNTSYFLNKPPYPFGGAAYAVDASLDALIAQGFADPDRIGLFGVSQGGFESLWLATQTKRFKAVVTMNGWSDMYSNRFDGNILQRYYGDQVSAKGEALRYEMNGGTSDTGIGVKVWDDPESYVRNSPLFHAPKVTAPILLIHSDMDYFNLNQYQMMFTALYGEKKEARLLIYAGEGHGQSSPANLRHMWSSIFAWFDRYVRSPSKDIAIRQ